jgi:hypothetical protein
MKRSILSLTTAIALALPATAQTDVEMTVMDVLNQNGYPEASYAMLTESEIANIYVTATSGTASDVERVLSGIDLPSDEASDVLRDSMAPSDVELAVRDILDRNGYDPDMIAAFSAGDIANIYTAATSENADDVDDALTSAMQSSTQMVGNDPSGAEERALEYLMTQGYSAAEIDAVDTGGLLSIYTALTSGNQSDVNRAVSSAIDA